MEREKRETGGKAPAGAAALPPRSHRIGTGLRRQALAVLAAGILASFFLMGVAPSAQAASRDVFEVFDVAATLDPDGSVQVTETIVLRFGAGSGRHGLERTIITREPDGPDHDMVFPVDQVSVTSPSGVSTELKVTDEGSGRERFTRIRVGSADRTITAKSATYVLTYRMRGLVRTSGSYDELYWDISGSSMPEILKATASISVPGGATDVFCSVALPGKKGSCERNEVVDKVAKFAADEIPRGRIMTVSVKVAPGLVSQNAPLRVENAEIEAERQGAWIAVGGAAVAGAIPLVGWALVRRRTHDYRYEGLPPGILPARETEPKEVRSPRVEIPVAFEPPEIAVAEAGLLMNGKTQVRDTTATLVSLAVAGAIQLRSDSQQQVRLVQPSRAPDRTSQAMLDELFPSRKAGKVVTLGKYGKMTGAHQTVQDEVLVRARKGHWYLRMPKPLNESLLLSLVFMVPAVVGVGVPFLVIFDTWIPALLVAAVYLTVLFARRRLSRGQRSARGRALTDQVEGFKKYLATAEAEQLRFEEGVDIFSRYLPWAIVFDLTERWTKVCQRLVELGRIPEIAPVWSYGESWSMHQFATQMNAFDHSVSSSIETSSPSFSGSGSGSSGSAFSSSDSGGFSGGGGGGGGGGSW